MQKKVYIILDGASETTSNETSLYKAHKPTIDLLASIGKIGFYVPEKRENDLEPKTDLVVPLFFGMDKTSNPGRAALELFDLGREIKPNTYSFAIKVDHSSSSMESINFLEEIIRITESFQIEVRVSEATNTGTRYLLGNIEPDFLAPILSKLKIALKLSYEIEDLDIASSTIANCQNIYETGIFLGWAKGALRGAFKYLGFVCNPFERNTNSFFDWGAYQVNFEDWVIMQLTKYKEYNTFIFYTKETAFASRFDLPNKKVEAIEFMDKNIKRILQVFNEDVHVIVLSDHSSNFNATDNPTANTFYILSKLKQGWEKSEPTRMYESFCEELIVAKNSDTISQYDLLLQIQALDNTIT